MNHSIYSADRTTHLKIVVIALVAGIATAGLGLLSHVSSDVTSSQNSVIATAGKPIVLTSSGNLAIR